MPGNKRADTSEKEFRSLLKQYRSSNDDAALGKMAKMLSMAPKELAVRLRYDFTDKQLESFFRAAKRAKLKRKLGKRY